MAELLKSFKKRDLVCFLTALLMIVAGVILDLRLPDYMSRMTVLVQTPGSETREVLAAGGRMLLCALGSLAAAITVAICASRMSADFGWGVRSRVFRKVQDFSMAEIGLFSTPSLITRTTNDVRQVQMLIVFGTNAIIKAPIMAAFAIAKIAGKERVWSFSTGAAVAIMLSLVGVSLVLTLPKFKKLQTLTDDLNRITRENLSGLKVVRAYNAEAYQQARFDDANEALTSTHLYTGRVMAFLMPVIQLVLNALTLSIYILGAFMIQRAAAADKLTIFSDMVVFSQYAMQVVMSFMMLVMIFIIFPRAQVSARRILEVLRQPCSIGNAAAGEGASSGDVEFRDVSFCYPGAEGDAVSSISFKAREGETLAIIGATGSGKSTIVNLIPRFCDATSGSVLVGGRDVRDMDLKELRRAIGYVPQKAQLFRGTVLSNILFGDSGSTLTEEDAMRAAGIAMAAEFIEEMPEGYMSPITQEGGNLSGGQKQRICIARAIARKPRILIFDDSFSALDYRTDKALRKELREQCSGVTRIIVAQRVGTIMDADSIVVLEDGCIAGIGTHRELLDSCEVYRQIAESQLTKEELA